MSIQKFWFSCLLLGSNTLVGLERTGPHAIKSREQTHSEFSRYWKTNNRRIHLTVWNKTWVKKIKESFSKQYIYTHTHTHIYIYINGWPKRNCFNSMYLHICVLSHVWFQNLGRDFSCPGWLLITSRLPWTLPLLRRLSDVHSICNNAQHSAVL